MASTRNLNNKSEQLQEKENNKVMEYMTSPVFMNRGNLRHMSLGTGPKK